MKVTSLKRLIALSLTLALFVAAVFACFKNISNLENAPDLTANALAIQSAPLSEDINLINLESVNNASDIPDGATEFEINSAKGIENFRNLIDDSDFSFSFENKIIYLTDDVKVPPFNGILQVHFPIGTLNPFKGIFDGCGYTISLINISDTTGNYGGLFGTTEGAVIKNLIVDNGKESGPIQNFGDCAYLGAIVGNAKNTTIINCVNKADIANSTSAGTAAGIAANADENTRIINCLNYGTISAENVAGITSSSQCEVSLCIDFLSTFETEDEEEKNWTDLSPAEKEKYITTLNAGIHAKRDSLYDEMLNEIPEEEEREYNYSKRLYLFYWGFDVEDTDLLALCFSNSYINYMAQKDVQLKAEKQKSGDTTYDGIIPLLEIHLITELISKNAAANSITLWFIDSYSLIIDADDFSTEKRNELLKKYFEFLEKLSDESIGEDADQHSIFKFAVRVEKFVNDACEEIDEILLQWESEYEKRYKNEAYNFAHSLITSWYNDSYNFIYGDDDIAANSRTTLEREYDNCIEALNDLIYKTEYSNNTELFIVIKQTVIDSYDALDNVYYEWELTSYKNELKAAYNNILETVSSKNKEKINQIKAVADITIAAALIEFNKANEAQGADRINNWIAYANTVEEAVYQAVAEFSNLEQEWLNQGKTTLWISISGGLLFTAVLTVVALLLILQKKQKQFNAIIFETQEKTDRKTKKYSEIAERISRENELQRAKAEQQAKLYRKQAEQALLEKQKQQTLPGEAKEQEFLYDELSLQPQKIKSKEKKRNAKKDEDLKE